MIILNEKEINPTEKNKSKTKNNIFSYMRFGFSFLGQL